MAAPCAEPEVLGAELNLASLSDDTLDIVLARCSVQCLGRLAQVSVRLCRHVWSSEGLWQRHFQCQCAPRGSAELPPGRGWRHALRGWLSYNPLACTVIQLPGAAKPEIFGVSLASAAAAARGAPPTVVWSVDSLGTLHEHGLSGEGQSCVHLRSVRVLQCAALAVEASGAEILVAGSG
eukprot:COSAG03_NODE_6186_length_1100_cov_1.255744_1_plen_178_part_10